MGPVPLPGLVQAPRAPSPAHWRGREIRRCCLRTVLAWPAFGGLEGKRPCCSGSHSAADRASAAPRGSAGLQSPAREAPPGPCPATRPARAPPRASGRLHRGGRTGGGHPRTGPARDCAPTCWKESPSGRLPVRRGVGGAEGPRGPKCRKTHRRGFSVPHGVPHNGV